MRNIAIPFFSLVVLFSCSKEKLTNENNEQPFIEFQIQSIWNSNNPHDSTGYFHNLIVDQTLGNYDISQLSNHQIFDAAKDMAIEILDFNYSEFLFDDVLEDFINGLTGSLNDDFAYLSTNPEFNAYAISFFEKVEVQDEFNSFETYIFFVKTEESVLLDSLSLPKIDEDLSLVLTSISRHSGQYWNDHNDGGDVEFFIIRVMADAAGGYLGWKIGTELGWSKRDTYAYAALCAAVSSVVMHSLLLA